MSVNIFQARILVQYYILHSRSLLSLDLNASSLVLLSKVHVKHATCNLRLMINELFGSVRDAK